MLFENLFTLFQGNFKMNSLRKWLLKPKRTDQSLLAKFYYADEELNAIASELDSFDGRKDTTRCNSLVMKLRNHQDSVLTIIEQIMKEIIPNSRARRDYRIKFPEEVLQESLAGQLWFGAECLAAGSSIVNKEIESMSMRPLAKSFTKQLDELRSLLREQCFKNHYTFTQQIEGVLISFDQLFADFELSYVSAMVPVKPLKEFDLLQDITVLFCETVSRAMELGLLNQDQFDAYDPILMFTIPRLTIVCGLLIYPDGPLNPDQDPCQVSEMFRQQLTLLFKIRELLITLQSNELRALEELICNPSESQPIIESKKLATVATTLSPSEERKTLNGIEIREKQEDQGHVLDDSRYSENDPMEAVRERRNRLGSCHSWPEDGNGELSSSPATDLEVDTLEKFPEQKQHRSRSGRGPSAVRRPLRPHYTMRSITWRGSNEFNFFLPRNTSIDDQSIDNVPYGYDHIRGASNGSPGGITTGRIACLQHRDSYHARQIMRLLQTNSRITQESSTGRDNPDYNGIDWPKGARPKQYKKKTNKENSYSRSMSCPLHHRSTEERVLSNQLAQVLSSPENHSPAAESSFQNLSAPALLGQSPSGSTCFEEKFFNENPATASLKISDLDVLSTGFKNTISSHDPPTQNTHNQTVFNDVDRDFDGDYDNDELIDMAGGKDGDDDNFKSRNFKNHDSLDVKPTKSGHSTSYSENVVGTSVDGEYLCCDKCGTPDLKRRKNGENEDYSPCHKSGSSSSDSLMYMEAEHDEISRIIQIAKEAAGLEARSKFKNSSDLVHQLFVCISKVADQLQTNFASDFRHILKATFECYSSTNSIEDSSTSPTTDISSTPRIANRNEGIPYSDDSGFEIDHSVVDALEELIDNRQMACREPFERPTWLPDESCSNCMSCKVPFTFVRRRHHCRNCGKIFCSQCSSNSVPLPHIGHAKPVRVCNACYLFHIIPFTISSQ